MRRDLHRFHKSYWAVLLTGWENVFASLTAREGMTEWRKQLHELYDHLGSMGFMPACLQIRALVCSIRFDFSPHSFRTVSRN